MTGFDFRDVPSGYRPRDVHRRADTLEQRVLATELERARPDVGFASRVAARPPREMEPLIGDDGYGMGC